MPDDMEMRVEIAAFDLDAIQAEERPGKPSGFGCPDCGGSLWEIQEGELIRFRCRVGHAWTANSLLAGQSEGVETALWTAFRALEERAALCNRIAERLRQRGSDARPRGSAEQAGERGDGPRSCGRCWSEPTGDQRRAGPAGDARAGGPSPDG